jgi:topoisomerase-4 subunit A
MLLGEFKGDDKLVVWTTKNQYYITGFGVEQHFPDDTIKVERYVAGKVYSLCYFDREQNYYYIKRFQLEPTDKVLSFLDSENPADFICITGVEGATLVVTYQGAHATRPADEIDVDSFIGVKSHRAKGKRITTYDVATLSFVEPEVVDEPEEDVVEGDMVDIDLEQVEKTEVEQVEQVEQVSNVVSMGASDDVVVIDSEQLNLF